MTQIQVEQLDVLHFKVEIHNKLSSSVDVDLNSLAQISSVKGFDKKNESGPEKLSWKISPNAHFQVSYRLPYDLTKFYYITSENYWIPVVRNDLENQKFEFKAKLKKGTEVIQSATGQSQDSWAMAMGPFVSYTSKDQRLKIYLVKEDSLLAQKLLEKLEFYLAQFESQLGSYPYDGFSVVESINEIGFAFPKMTWIGSQLIRFPFILTTSLPHEILHSWWGNGVFVDYQSGNWCEGLTSFGADYALLNESGKKLYRLKALSQYENYVKDGKDLPLSKFVSRGEDRSLQAIGYDKALMVFVMLEQRMGPAPFQKALRQFYKKYQFKRASYSDLFQEFEKASGQNLSAFKNYWIQSTGSLKYPFLLAQKRAEPNPLIDWELKVSEAQKIPGQPILAQLQNGNSEEPQKVFLRVNEDGSGLKASSTPILSQKSPTAYHVDPDFYLFRKLEDVEKPVVFSALFGARQVYNDSLQDDWVVALQSQFKDMQVGKSKWQPTSDGIYLLSLESALRSKEVASLLEKRDLRFSEGFLHFQGKDFSLLNQSFFASLIINKSQIFIVHLAPNLTSLRWFQRWSRYGAQSYLVLSDTAASAQGIWLEPFWTQL